MWAGNYLPLQEAGASGQGKGEDGKERGMEMEAWELGPCASADAENLCPA